LRWLRRVLLAVGLASLIFVIPTVWFRPWSVNHLYLRVMLELFWKPLPDPIPLKIQFPVSNAWEFLQNAQRQLRNGSKMTGRSAPARRFSRT
jgi:hypothetical protein